MRNFFNIALAGAVVTVVLITAMSIQHAPEPSECFFALSEKHSSAPMDLLLACVVAEAGIELEQSDDPTLRPSIRKNNNVYIINQQITKVSCASTGIFWHVDPDSFEVIEKSTWGVVC